MRTYAQKYQQAQREASDQLARSSTTAARGHTRQPIPRAQHTIEDQAAQRLFRAESEGSEAGFNARATDRPAHDFDRVSVYAQAPVQLQAKLTVNSPDDLYEQEADRAADQVMRSSASHQPRACGCGAGCAGCRQERGAHEHVQTKPVQERQPAETGVPPVVQEVVSSPGQPLDVSTREFMEARFGHNFSRVRVHADAKATDSARQIDALAYTLGTDIVFAAGRYDTATTAGRRLLAHELAHVVQQTGGGPATGAPHAIQRQPAPAAGTGSIPSPAIGPTDLRENASPILASALGSTVIDRFALGSATIPKAGEDSLRYAAKQILFFIRKYPRSTLHIAGYTDRVGTDERNLSLGQSRADAVSAFLQQEGVPADIISTESKGESDPVVPTKNDQAEPRNRRVNVFFRVEKSSLSFGLDSSLKPPSFEQKPSVTLPKPPLDLDLDKRRIPYRDPAETELWKRMEETQRKIDEFDRTHPKESKSLGQAAIDLVMKDVVNPILKKLPLPDNLRKKAEEGIRKGLESGSEKACELAIDQLDTGSTEKDALKAVCKATLKQKPGGGKP